MGLNIRNFTDIVGCSCKGVGFLSGFELLCQAVVRNLEVSVSFKENILGLEVPVDEAELMQVLHGKEDLRRIELRSLLCEFLALSQMREHLSASYEIHHKKDLFLRLEGELQTDQKGMFC
jgi:hypothetical protein